MEKMMGSKKEMEKMKAAMHGRKENVAVMAHQGMSAFMQMPSMEKPMMKSMKSRKKK